MKVAVLGGDGFLGSHMVDQLYTLGHDITVFDRFPLGETKNLKHLKGKVSFVKGEFGNIETLKEVFEGVDVAYHFISCTNPATSWNNPLFEVEENLLHSLRCFEVAVKMGVKKIVFPSSGGTVYGKQTSINSENTLPNPFNPYGITKLSTEYFLNYFKEHSNLNYDVYRISNPFGPRQPMDQPQGVIAVWMKSILEEKELKVYGDAKTVRDYVYIKDVSYLMTHSLKDLHSSGTFNIGSGKGVSILELLDVFKKVIDKPFTYELSDKRNFDNSSAILDSTKLLGEFKGFTLQNIEEKIKETWHYVQKHYQKS
ncbi:MAG: NAD-dependent epimerase/dehydratase family protein [Nitrospinae bacterium]|nr:NAD-dependent epimerase/dehydratase family protein [Nitrospinota bacterium]